MAEFREIYPDDEDLMNSTAAARVNGYLGGCGTRKKLGREIDDFGLEEAGRRALLDAAARNR